MKLISKIILMVFVLLFFYISTVLSFIMGNVNKSETLDYIALVNFAFENFTNFSNFDPIILPNTILGWANQIQLVNSAHILNGKQFFINYSPFVDFLQNSLIFKVNLITYNISDLPEYILFKETLIKSGEIPYLTNPLFAESFLLGGWFSLVLYSFIYGFVCHLFFKLGSINLMYLFFYFSFYFIFTFGMLQSINSSGLNSAMKTLMVLYVLIVISKINFKKNVK
jgi:hypothetical protein